MGVGTILGLKTQRIIALVVGLLVLSGIVTGGIALAGDLSAQPEPSLESAAATLSPELSAHFAALSETPGAEVTTIASADTEAKSRIKGAAEGAISSQFGLGASLAREVTYKSRHVWLIPGSTGIGFSDLETGTGAGGSIAKALEGEIITDVGGDENGITGGGTVYGIAPNGNSNIVVHDADGSTEEVPIEHNVYIITHPGAVSIELVDASGELQTITVPG